MAMIPSDYDLELAIERLVLHGIAPQDRHRLGAALQQELTRLLTEQGIPPRLTQASALAQLKVSPCEVSADARPEAIGTQLAQTIYQGLTAPSPLPTPAAPSAGIRRVSGLNPDLPQAGQ
jgi:hypothetical protein